MLIPRNHLTFGEIARLWAEEDAGKAFAASHDDILDFLERALRYGEFDFATLTVDEAPRDVLADIDPSRPADLVRVGPSRMAVTRGTLDRMLFPYSDKLTRELWLEGLRISRDDFGRWCEKKGHEQPTFWPQKNDAPKAQLAPGPPRRGIPKGKTS